MKSVRTAAGLLVAIAAVAVARSSHAQTAPRRIECDLGDIRGVLASDGYLMADGWAADRIDGAPVYKVGLAIDGGSFTELDRGGPRPDVRMAFGREDFLFSSFFGLAPLAGLKPGKHVVEVAAWARDGTPGGCGVREIFVRDFSNPPEPPAWRIGFSQFARAAVALLLLGVAGWPLSAWTERGVRLLTAPLLGFALFGVASEIAGLVHVHPLPSFLAVSGLLLGVHATGKVFPRRRAFLSDAAWVLPAVILFMAIGCWPMAVHGPGVVMGKIDDAVRECMRADAILLPSRTGEGYAALVPYLMGLKSFRFGSSFLLAALAEPEGLRAHEVHSSAMLLAGALTIVSAGLLARRLLPGAAPWRQGAVILVAANSILFTTLYNQHLGNLSAVPVFVLFVTGLYDVLRRRETAWLLPPALALSASFTIYPEILPLFALSALAAIVLSITRRAPLAALLRLLLVAVLAAALNPPGVVRFVRSSLVTTSEVLSPSPAKRMTIGDTHYFPSLAVLSGAEPYRIDAPAPMQTARRVLVGAASIVVALGVLAGLMFLPGARRRTVLFLLAPLAVAFAANRALDYPYGYSKILPLALPLWTVSFVLSWQGVNRVAERLVPKRTVRALAAAGLAALLLLSMLASRHVLIRAVRLVPAFDPAYTELPALIASLPPRAFPRADQPLGANREWVRYMLRDVTVDSTAAPVPAGGRPRFLILDRRTLEADPPDVAARTPRFLAVPLLESR